MIRILQRKFIGTAMVAITVLIFFMVGSINFFNVLVNRSRVDAVIQSIVEAHFKGEDNLYNSNKTYHGNKLVYNIENREKSAFFFTALVDKNTAILTVNVDRIANISYEEAESITKNAVISEKEKGTIDGFKFQAINRKDETVLYIFLENSQEVFSEAKIAIISIIAGIVCWFMMFLLVALLSKKVIQPISENMEKQKQFITDAGHEIKTPLAIIQSNTDALELYSGESKYSKNIKVQIKRLSLLTHDMLLLAKNSEDGVEVGKITVDLSHLVLEGCNVFGEALAEKNITLQADIAPAITLQGNYELLEKMVSILMDNILKYGQENSVAKVHLYQKERQIVLTVSNQCEALPSCDAEKLFDRFYRGDIARNQQNGGFGIGLSSARSIVELHKGRIHGEYIGENKISFTVKFPQTNSLFT